MTSITKVFNFVNDTKNFSKFKEEYGINSLYLPLGTAEKVKRIKVTIEPVPES